MALAKDGDQLGDAGYHLTVAQVELADQRPSVNSSLEQLVLRLVQFSQILGPGKAFSLECLVHGTRCELDDRAGNVLDMHQPVGVLIQ